MMEGMRGTEGTRAFARMIVLKSLLPSLGLSVKFSLVCLFNICVIRFSSNLIACYPLHQDTEIGVKEPQASRGDEQGFIIVALIVRP